MTFRWNLKDQLLIARFAFKWLLIVTPVATVIGSMCAFFLWSLDKITNIRWQFPWLIFLLPVAGFLVGLLYEWLGQSVEAGNNLIIEQIHEPGGGIPKRMAPFILISTLITHLFGGSVGREGTAVQMGGSIASAFARWFRLHQQDMRLLLMAGMAAGFGGVFGTPLSGAIFAMEVLTIGYIEYEAIFPCLLAAILGNAACLAWGIHHTRYQLAGLVDASHFSYVASGLLLGKVAIAAVAFGLASVLFAELTHGINSLLKKIFRWAPLRPLLGGLIVVLLTYFVGRDYLGLGDSSPDPSVVTIMSSFTAHGAHTWSWLWKLIFTSVTVGSGFKGGEVTPLFFIGATLGNALSQLLNAPTDLFAALGLVAIFSGATNTPIASTLMGIELFGTEYTIPMALACFVAYLFSGHSSIYLSQRIFVPKAHENPLHLKVIQGQKTPEK